MDIPFVQYEVGGRGIHLLQTLGNASLMLATSFHILFLGNISQHTIGLHLRMPQVGQSSTQGFLISFQKRLFPALLAEAAMLQPSFQMNIILGSADYTTSAHNFCVQLVSVVVRHSVISLIFEVL